jgi:FixJ family two-component response regulator
MSEQIKRHVYIVDDENVIAFSLAAILKSYGFDATFKWSGWQDQPLRNHGQSSMRLQV